MLRITPGNIPARFQEACFSADQASALAASTDNEQVKILCNVFRQKIERIKLLEEKVSSLEVNNQMLRETQSMLHQFASTQIKANPHDATAKKVKALTG